MPDALQIQFFCVSVIVSDVPSYPHFVAIAKKSMQSVAMHCGYCF